MLARRYGESPALFGYDLMNEPHPGRPGGKIFRKLIAKLIRVCAVSPSVRRVWFLKSILSKDLQTRGHALDVLTPAVMKKITSAANALVRRFDEAYYTPFVARMTQAIRAVTQNGIILMEHSYFSNLGIPFCAKAPAGEGVCYSPHAYDFTVDTEAYAFASNERLRFIFGESRRAQGRLNVPVLVGEWGGGGKGETFFPHIEYLMNLFDSYGWSNAYFAYKPGFFETPLMRVVSRPYPMAVGGALERFQIDLKAKTATLWYHPQGGLWTELYLPRGYASVDAGEGAEVLHEGNVLKIRGGGNRIAVKYK
jgi:endoglycosylceramidase